MDRLLVGIFARPTQFSVNRGPLVNSIEPSWAQLGLHARWPRYPENNENSYLRIKSLPNYWLSVRMKVSRKVCLPPACRLLRARQVSK